MNRKLFAALLLLPITIFATERIVSPNLEGGGKAKKQAKTQSQAESPNAAQAAQANAENDLNANTPAPTPFPEMVAALKIELADSKISEEIFSKFEGSYDRISDISESAINKMREIERRLTEADYFELEAKMAFSRCGSGYDVIILEKDENLFRSGYMVFHRGCENQRIGEIRFDENAENVSAKINDAIGFVSIDEFFKVLKAAMS